MDMPSQNSLPTPQRMTRAQNAVVWGLILVVTFGGLGAAAYFAFSSQQAPPQRVYASTMKDLRDEARSLPIVEVIPDEARDIRLMWIPGKHDAAAVWHAPADSTSTEGCEVVDSPAAPAVAQEILQLGPEPYSGFDCGDHVIVVGASSMKAWSVQG